MFEIFSCLSFVRDVTAKAVTERAYTSSYIWEFYWTDKLILYDRSPVWYILIKGRKQWENEEVRETMKETKALCRALDLASAALSIFTIVYIIIY